MTEREQAIITKYDLLFESRLTRVEADSKHLNSTCEELKSDMRWLMRMFVGGFLILAALIGKGFHWFS
jgi:hypothetical protein